jgi:hypothetical protein
MVVKKICYPLIYLLICSLLVYGWLLQTLFKNDLYMLRRSTHYHLALVIAIIIGLILSGLAIIAIPLSTKTAMIGKFAGNFLSRLSPK